MQAATAPRETYYMTPDGHPTQFDKRLITDIKPDYVSYSSFESADPIRLKGRNDISDTGKALAIEYTEFMEALQEGFDPDREFGDEVSLVQDLAYIQPQVLVWKRKATN